MSELDLDVYDIHKKYKDKLKDSRYNVKKNNLHEYNIIPNHPFRSMLVGGSGSGKTSLMMVLLTDKKFLYDYFDKIYIFCPTFFNDDLYGIFRLAYDQDKKKPAHTTYEVFDTINKETINTVNDIMEEQKNLIDKEGVSKSPRLLWIFDDVVGETGIDKPLIKLLTKSRHYNSSVFVISQSYNRIPRAARLQFSNLFLFSLPDSEIDIVAKNHCNCYFDQKHVRAIIEHCNNQGKFLHINQQSRKYHDWYRCGLDEIFDVRSFENKAE